MITGLRVGDYIEKSELDTEQKYNDVVAIFRERGFEWGDYAAVGFNIMCRGDGEYLSIDECGFYISSKNAPHLKRKLTYNDIMSLKKVDVDEAFERHKLKIWGSSSCSESMKIGLVDVDNCNIDKVVSGNESTDNAPKIHPSLLDGSDLNVGSRSNGGPVNSGPFAEPETTEKINIKEMIKAAKAVLAMKSLGHEWDEEKGQWFRKEYF